MNIYLSFYKHDLLIISSGNVLTQLCTSCIMFNVSSQTLGLGIYRLMVIDQKQGLLSKGKAVGSRCVSYMYVHCTCTCS